MMYKNICKKFHKFKAIFKNKSELCDDEMN